MTVPVEAEEAILARWSVEWGTTTPFGFGSEDAPVAVSRGEEAWALLQIVDTLSEQQTLGRVTNRKFLRRGAVSVLIYTPTNQGTRQALVLAQQAREIFEAVGFSGLSFYAGSMDRIGPVPPEYLIAVAIPFDYVERK